MNYFPIEEQELDEYDSIKGATIEFNNLKIRVMPSITTNAALDGEDFDCSLTKEQEAWLGDFKKIWTTFRAIPIETKQSLWLFLEKDPNPMLFALKLFANCPGCNTLKAKSLPLFILETICKMQSKYPHLIDKIDNNTRMVSFNFVKMSGMSSLFKSITDAYELKAIRELLEPKLNEMLMDGNYKDAAFWAIHLDLTQTFNYQQIVFPLLLQDKNNVAEEYLDVAIEQQLPFIQFLDSFIKKDKTVASYDEIYKEYANIERKGHVCNYRTMTKLITRLSKKYNIDENLTPNVKYCKASSYICFLCRSYGNGEMNVDSWRELVRDATLTTDLQLELVKNIAHQCTVEEAVYWAKSFQLPAELCPVYIQNKLNDAIEENVIITGNSNDCDLSKRQHLYLNLEISDDCIHFICTEADFVDMISFLKSQKMISFDSEWKPSANVENNISILQLAAYDRIYLVDCLSPNLTAISWKTLSLNLLNNINILKIGFSLHHDLRMICKYLPVQLIMPLPHCFLDLHKLFNYVKKMKDIQFPYEKQGCSGESLSTLVLLCFGKRLDKSNQCSDWTKRPLRYEQKIYAALDVYCLLQIYDVFKCLFTSSERDISVILDEIVLETSLSFQLNRRSLERSIEINPPEIDFPSVSPNERDGAVGFFDRYNW